ncbi:S8 family serine peptidase [Salinibacter sp.]|uniref:S8 family serine peptidase n=1 Tax=Salinibacter sp. TaxID=2065818 RepID=UPI0021E9826B|nr:S8 family serine peptidase [Salinibacter sp.]
MANEDTATASLLPRLPRVTYVAGLFALALGLTSVPSPAQDLPGQSLSDAERSKLDGRFERVVLKAQGGTLGAAIQEMEEVARQQPPQAARRDKGAGVQRGNPEGKVSSEGGMKSFGARSQPSLQRLPVDVRPDGKGPGGTPIYSAIVEAESPAEVQVPGVTVVSAFDGFATVRATPQGLRSLAGSPAVTKVRSPKMARSQNDIGAAEVGARTLNSGVVGRTEYKGEGTLACVIDSGIDWSHPDFTDEDGNTRIRAIWDQVDDSTTVNTPVGNDPSRFRQDFNPDYGSEYLREDIQAALNGNGSINQEDIDGHGTHVAGTVASSGEAYRRSSGTKRYRGAAPKADLIVVKAGNERFATNNWLNGIVYCQDVAEAAGKPVVINMSLGGQFTPHDGSAVDTRAVEQLSQKAGTAIVTAAGNDGSPFTPIHTQKSLSAGDSVSVGIDVTQYTPNDGAFNDLYTTTLWTYQPGPYKVSVYTPSQQDTLTVTVDGSQSVRDTSVATPRGVVFLESSTEGNGRYFQIQSFDAFENQPPAEGQWSVRIRHQGQSATPVHGWFLDSNLGSGQGAGSASFAQADNQFTIGSPATSRGAIAVGNYTLRTRWANSNGDNIGIPDVPKGVITPSSSRGPTVDGRTKPDVSAPGRWIPSALSDDASPSLEPNLGVVGDGEHQVLNGTSMAAPLTAGSVALLMQEQPSLSTDEVRSLLRNTARSGEFVEGRGGPPNQTFGAGKLNVQRALTSLTGEAAPLEVLSYHQPADFDQDASVTLGGGAAERAALRFTPTQTGRVAGTYLSLADNQQGGPANELTDSLRVEVWTDQNGNPGRQIGASVAADPSALRGFSPTFVDLSNTGATVQPGQDYHIVIAPEEEGGSVKLLAEMVGSAAGRSATFNGSSWVGTGNDLVARVQVRTDVTAPPSVADLGVGTAEPQDISLSWDGVGDPDLGEYLVFRDTDPIGPAPNLTPFDTLGVEATSFADTTATNGQTYYYRVAAVDQSGNMSPLSSPTSAFLYPDDVRAEFTRSFENGGASSSDYRLVALPGAVDRGVGDVLPGEDGVDWSVLWDDGSESDFFVEYDGSDTFAFQPGRGFWVVSRENLSVRDSISTVSLQSDTAATIPLHDGWNIISNPFGKAVLWSRVDAANDGALQPPFGFEGSFSKRDALASAKTGRAFYFLNDQGLSELTIPYPGAPQQAGSSASVLAASGSASETISVTATTGNGQDSSSQETSSTVQVRGTSGPEAKRKVVAPPQRFESVSLRVRNASTENPRKKLLTATSRDLTEGQTIPLTLRVDTSSAEIRAQVKGLGNPSVALIDPSTGRSYDLSGGQTVTVDAGAGESQLKLAVGTDGYVKGQLQSVTPEDVTLTTAPNPFRKQTTIRYALPEEASVQLKVYDTLGRQVATLVDGQKIAGKHQVQFSGTDLSSGTYFGRLQVGDQTRTQKITVVR